MMLILGVVHFLRASDVSFLRKLRTSQFWITFEAFGFAFYGYVPYVHGPPSSTSNYILIWVV
jgi:hypothetical protein